MSRNINVTALLKAINADLDKLGANKGQRSRIEKLAKAACAEPTTSKRKPKNTEKKHARGKMFKEDKSARKSKKDKTPKRNIRNKREREDRKTPDDNKVVVKHARLRAVKVKRTQEKIETPSKVREAKKRKTSKKEKRAKQASEKRVVAKSLKRVVKKLARNLDKVAKNGRK